MTAINPLSRPQRDVVLTALLQAAGLPDNARESHRPLTISEVGELGASNTVTIGAHSHHHPRLSELSVAEQTDEIEDGRQRLAAWLGRSVDTFAYPYGSLDTYTPETIGLLRRNGFSLACSNYAGLVMAGVDRFQLPRVLIRNIPPAGFRQLIEDSFRQLDPGLRG